MHRKPDLSLDDFRKWMKDQKGLPELNHNSTQREVGLNMESKVSMKKLANKINIESGEFENVLSEFKKDGGIVKDVDGKMMLIEVSCGSFFVSRQYLREKF